MLAVVIVEAAAIALLGLLVAGLLRSHAEILKSLHELGAGREPDPGTATVHPGRIVPLGEDERAHDVAGHRLDGTAAAVGVAGARHDTMLVFLSSGCLSCRPFWDDLRAGVTAPDPVRTVVVVQDED